MGQGNEREVKTFPGKVPLPANDVLELIRRKELTNCQSTDWNHKVWP